MGDRTALPEIALIDADQATFSIVARRLESWRNFDFRTIFHSGRRAMLGSQQDRDDDMRGNESRVGTGLQDILVSWLDRSVSAGVTRDGRPGPARRIFRPDPSCADRARPRI